MAQIEAQEVVSRWLNGLPSKVQSRRNIENPESDIESNSSKNEDNSDSTSPPIHMGINLADLQEFGCVISTMGRNKISIGEIEDWFDVPAYPRTSLEGVLHFIHFNNPLISETSTQSEVIHAMTKQMSKVQFSSSHRNINSTSFLPLGIEKKDERNRVWHRQYTCSGIQHCQYANPLVLSTCSAYDNVILEKINDLQKQSSRLVMPTGITSQILEYTEAYFNGFLSNWNRFTTRCQFQITNERTCAGRKPEVFKRHGVEYMGCGLNSDVEPWHTAVALSIQTARIDINYLKILINNGSQQVQKHCTYIGHATSRRKLCGYDHPQGQGRVVRQTCNVKFDLYIPKNMIRFPYICLVAKGSHTHHPPYPTRLPIDIANDLQEVIRQADTLTLTTQRFILTPQFARLQEKYQESSLRAIHASLNIEDRLTALIRKERILQYPAGTDVAGVYREYSVDVTKNNNDQWIRSIIYLDSKHYLIICISAIQARQFVYTKHIEIDLSFKMVAGNCNLFSVVGWHEQHKKILVFGYVFMNTDTRIAYSTMFTELFKQFQEAGRQPVRFYHIHQSGVVTVGCDMCKKQAGGLGDALHLIDPRKTWDEHLEHVLVLCRVHVQRNFMKRFPQHRMKFTIFQDIFCGETRTSILENMQRICEEEPILKTWINSKKVPWVLAGLCVSESKVPIEYWMFARKHTGNGEASHFQENNFAGRKTSLLNAVLKLKVHTLDIFARLDMHIEQGIASTWTNLSDANRIAKIQRKNDKAYRQAALRRKSHPHRPFNPNNPYDTPIPSLSQGREVLQSQNSSVSVLAEHMPGISQPFTAMSPSISDTVDFEDNNTSSIAGSVTGSAYSQHMLPPSNQAHAQQRKRSRNQRSIDTTIQNVALERLLTLEQRVQAARQIKEEILNHQKEKALLKELEELENFNRSHG